MATMDRIGVSVSKRDVDQAANLMTATPDLKRWYMIRGDQPLAKQSSRMCVSAAGRNLEINDYRRNGEPTVTPYQFERGKALAECKEIAKNFIDGEKYGIGCNERQEMMRILAENVSERIALQGVTDQQNLMTIIADPADENDFRMLVTARAGATGIALRGDKFVFSQWILSVLDKR